MIRTRYTSYHAQAPMYNMRPWYKKRKSWAIIVGIIASLTLFVRQTLFQIQQKVSSAKEKEEEVQLTAIEKTVQSFFGNKKAGSSEGEEDEDKHHFDGPYPLSLLTLFYPWGVGNSNGQTSAARSSQVANYACAEVPESPATSFGAALAQASSQSENWLGPTHVGMHLVFLLGGLNLLLTTVRPLIKSWNVLPFGTLLHTGAITLKTKLNLVMVYVMVYLLAFTLILIPILVLCSS